MRERSRNVAGALRRALVLALSACMTLLCVKAHAWASTSVESDLSEGGTDASMMLVFDVSGSMDDSSAMGGFTKLDSAKRQSTDFVNSIGRQDGPGGISVRVGVASFSSSATVDCPLSTNAGDITDSIQNLSAGGNTNIYEGLRAGVDELMGQTGSKLMVFLSDGMSNTGGTEEDILDVAREAKADGIKIYTIGFGASGDLDEDLLREIADITGGSYSHEDSSDISAAAVGLFATMMGAQLESTSQVLVEGTGTVQQGGTTEVGTFDVDQNGTMTAYLYWPGSILDLQLTDPDGMPVGEGYSGYSIDTSTIPTSITVTNAKKGTWHMSVFGKEVSMAAEPFYAVAALSNIQPEVAAPVSSGGGGGAVNDGSGIMFLFFAVATASLVGVYALSVRGK